jgi:ABC-2 type transport system ATP-binding protein
VNAVEVEGLEVERGGKPVLLGLSFAVPRGEVTGLLGPSGCGKTTLMRSIVGVQVVKAGAVRVLGEPAGSGPVRARVGYMTQAAAVYGDMSARENLRYFARVVGADAERVEEVIATVRLDEHADRAVRDLSGGQQARASLATAMIGEPEVLVLDEPTVGLDPVLRQDLWDTFHRLAGEGATLLVSSHVMDEAERCRRLMLMREGRLLAEGTPDELRDRTSEQDMEQVFLRLVEEGAER